VWRLYMAASAVNFEGGRTQIHQILAAPTTDDGDSGLPLRPTFE
jgi:cyclopropane-fatty-acyl-phospholipid synthase